MTDGSAEIIRLLTEMRDAQRDEIEYRREVAEESLELARRGVRTQRRALLFAGVGLPILLVLAALLLSAAPKDGAARGGAAPAGRGRGGE